ncbi:succinyl-CoA synthetase subunit beta [Marinobacter sp.]|uniref:succinyl-CoA synthetase subunit beta n=1 Tax=Marinobacter sp. TaxID=50741 RepID=UPI002353C2F5|nr:succinyl-CoA synthetase subunit beta [Marinobacter sp.]
MASGSIPANTPRRQRLRSLALVGVVLLTPLLFIGRPDWLPGGFNFAAWNLGHVLLFALLTLAVNPRRWLGGWRLWLASTTAVLAFGIAVETVQAGMGRDFDLRDLLRNLIGLWFVLAWQPLLTFRVRKPAITAVLALTSSLLLVYELSTTGVQAARYFKLEHQLPQVYDFDHSNPSSYWRGSVEPSSRHNGDHDQSLKIELGTKRYSAASLYRVPSDWRDFDTLTLRLHNPTPEPLTLILRINDIQHERGSNALNDRYNTRLNLTPGVSSHTIALEDIEKAPATRTMNLRQVRRLTLSSNGLSEPRTVYLQELRLD